MKPVKTKEEIRQELDAQIGLYLSKGGRVSQHAPGESGRSRNEPLNKPPFIERSGDQNRTQVMTEIQAIEERRQQLRRTKKPAKRRPKPRRTLLKDDFGEPLRWITD